jgi:hypothetical protein
MESLFRLTELESRIPLNMNVLVGGLVPRVIGLSEALRGLRLVLLADDPDHPVEVEIDDQQAAEDLEPALDTPACAPCASWKRWN